MQQISKLKTIKIFLFAFLLFAAGIINAQVGIGIATPNASAQLDVSSTSKGFLPPRMTLAQRNAIASPVAGLTIWCKDCGVLGEIQVYNGTTWTNMTGGYPTLPIPATVTIGTRVWMTRNLDVTTYRNGDTIPEIKDPLVWDTLTTGAWCYYNNDPALGAIYGKLYNRHAIVDPRGLAPVGWHVSTGDDWRTLGSNADTHKATTLWNIPYPVVNQSGFTALPGGLRDTLGIFGSIGSTGNWWTPDQVGTASGGGRGGTIDNIAFQISSGSDYLFAQFILYFNYLDYDRDGVPEIDDYYSTNFGFSVRCVKD